MPIILLFLAACSSNLVSHMSSANSTFQITRYSGSGLSFLLRGAGRAWLICFFIYFYNSVNKSKHLRGELKHLRLCSFMINRVQVSAAAVRGILLLLLCWHSEMLENCSGWTLNGLCQVSVQSERFLVPVHYMVAQTIVQDKSKGGNEQ